MFSEPGDEITEKDSSSLSLKCRYGEKRLQQLRNKKYAIPIFRLYRGTGNNHKIDLLAGTGRYLNAHRYFL
jgi:hypothetical protein